MCIVFVLMNGVTPRATRTDTLFHYPTCFRSPAGTAPRRDTRVIGLNGVAHAGRHFYQLVLPPLFPLLKDDFGVGYAELGLLMALFYGTSGVAQTVAGFMVDRFGARVVVPLGFVLLCGSSISSEIGREHG